MVIDANEKIARNTDCPKAREEAIIESVRTGKPVEYRVGHFKFTVNASLNLHAPIATDKEPK